MEKNKFLEKYSVWFFLGGVIVLIVVLKLIGFPGILVN